MESARCGDKSVVRKRTIGSSRLRQRPRTCREVQSAVHERAVNERPVRLMAVVGGAR